MSEEPNHLISECSSASLDKWISSLMQCKPLAECEVKELCQKVSSFRG